MRSALRKRPDSLACAAAALFPASPRPGREYAKATMPTRDSRLSAGSGR
ncbi:putative protein OS=Streptomyces aurantiogriseus OX=66870 GN=GCM10010251_59690 PE=4 SV=1 [Streptomyces aurantiogriseus]|uniref:Uncharacterized protein n=1 Tax=Streptomyces aurantiogriseus TaxID=66870 RepID=A0A918FFW6_9ACTN|nr:hypothetical protein GCM10010251_59690 [Streptomyces aurantiogriseus]